MYCDCKPIKEKEDPTSYGLSCFFFSTLPIIIQAVHCKLTTIFRIVFCFYKFL